jgi:hypothetical protein
MSSPNHFACSWACVRVTVDVPQEARVVGRDELRLADADAVCQPQSDDRLPEAVLHRLPEAEIGGKGQRCHELGQADG